MGTKTNDFVQCTDLTHQDCFCSSVVTQFSTYLTSPSLELSFLSQICKIPQKVPILLWEISSLLFRTLNLCLCSGWCLVAVRSAGCRYLCLLPGHSTVLSACPVLISKGCSELCQLSLFVSPTFHCTPAPLFLQKSLVLACYMTAVFQSHSTEDGN